ncbi:MAG: ATP-binding protein [Rhodocyclaceae bacterium]
MLTQSIRLAPLWQGAVFICGYVLLDWASYLHPLHGLNITPWNPSLALGLVYWFRVGRWAALAWFAAILIGEILVRGLPAALPMTIGLSAALTAGYGAMADALRWHVSGEILHDRRRLLAWLTIVVAGTLATSGMYVSLLRAMDLIPLGDWDVALVRFWVGDCVGIVVTMPFFWLLVEDRNRLVRLLTEWETAGYGLAAVAVLWVAFGFGGAAEFQYFYLLFIPIVWAAARQGVPGAAIAAFALQAGIIVTVQWQDLVAVTVFELQMLGAVLAFVGLFIGVVVDEKERVSDELRQSLRLAAAGEMAGALAHELNQPLTALSVYGKACEQMLERGETGERLGETIRRMVAESFRAADVVRRLRDFFRTGATRLEPIVLPELLHAAAAPFALKARQQGIDFLVAPSPGETLSADRLQLEVVLRNLLANAFEAVAEQPEGMRRVRLSARNDGPGHVCVQIEDNGPGPSAVGADRLFRPFQSSKASGLGLGLAISRAIVQAHGGELWAEVTDHGMFLVRLPTKGE